MSNTQYNASSDSGDVASTGVSQQKSTGGKRVVRSKAARRLTSKKSAIVIHVDHDQHDHDARSANDRSVEKPLDDATATQTLAPIIPPESITKPPKVTARTLSKAEKAELKKAHKAHVKAEERRSKVNARGPLWRWLSRKQATIGQVEFGMALVALGVVYGDIGTSPLYVFQTFVSGQGGVANVDRLAVLGMLSLVFWSITLITTIKYVLVAMRIDNKGEGGIFALYSLVRRYAKWLVIPAMLGGAAFLADSVLTPAVSISSAVEGLGTLPLLEGTFNQYGNLSLVITLVVIIMLFLVQSRGTERIGKVFGTLVLIWFTFLAVVGLVNIRGNWGIFAALNPVYGLHFLFSGDNVAGITLMGTVFLATTGAEALYSDMGHVGRGNIYVTWPFVNIALVCNYFGQGAWLLRSGRDSVVIGTRNLNPFFQMMDPNIRYVAVLLSVIAGVIASQALITGAFTMVSEATGLNWMPHLQVRYPAKTRGQIYIPAVNVVLCLSTLTVLLIFKDSDHIAAAYGLALTVTMITTTILLGVYLWYRASRFKAVVFTVVFLTIQFLFFIASLTKFMHGGWFTMLLTLAILMVMYTWAEGTRVERSQRRHMAPEEFLPALDMLHDDFRIPYFSDNVVYLTSDNEMRRLDTDIYFSIFADHPKRARAWWSVSVQTTDAPFTREYSVESFGTNYLFRVRIRLGFKVDQNVSTYLHQVMHELIDSKELPRQKSIYPKLDEDPQIGTIRYVLIHKALMPESKIDSRGALSLKIKYAIRHVAGSPSKWFGLAPYNPLIEVQPLFVSTRRVPRLKRVAEHRPWRPAIQGRMEDGRGGKSRRQERQRIKKTAKTDAAENTGRMGTKPRSGAKTEEHPTEMSRRRGPRSSQRRERDGHPRDGQNASAKNLRRVELDSEG